LGSRFAGATVGTGVVTVGVVVVVEVVVVEVDVATVDVDRRVEMSLPESDLPSRNASPTTVTTRSTKSTPTIAQRRLVPVPSPRGGKGAGGGAGGRLMGVLLELLTVSPDQIEGTANPTRPTPSAQSTSG
jgi:hypothetical protein